MKILKVRLFFIYITFIFLFSSCVNPKDIQPEYFDFDKVTNVVKYKEKTEFNFNELEVISRAGKGFEKVEAPLKKYLMTSLKRELKYWKKIDYYYHSLLQVKENEYPVILEIDYSNGAKCSLILFSFDRDGKFIESVELAHEWAINEWYSKKVSKFDNFIYTYNLGPADFYDKSIDTISSCNQLDSERIILMSTDTIFTKN